MNLGLITLCALALAVILSCTTSLNVGLLSIALAWFIGVYLGHMPLKEITGGFPVDLFLTLAGVTLLFSQARVNGTLERVAHLAVRLWRDYEGPRLDDECIRTPRRRFASFDDWSALYRVAGPKSRRLFNQMLAWGLSMTVVGALICWIFFG
jgi:hypothetical protein